MTWLLRYWKPLAVLALLVAVFAWGWSTGHKAGAATWRMKFMDNELAYQREKLADSEAARKALEKVVAERNAAQKEINRLASLPPKVIERVRTNPSHCVLPRPVTDGLRDQANETNSAIRLRRAARAAGK